MSDGPRPAVATALPFVSVVVPTGNHAWLVAECLASFRGPSYPRDRFEVLVVDDGSADATADVVRTQDDGCAPLVRCG